MGGRTFLGIDEGVAGVFMQGGNVFHGRGRVIGAGRHWVSTERGHGTTERENATKTNTGNATRDDATQNKIKIKRDPRTLTHDGLQACDGAQCARARVWGRGERGGRDCRAEVVVANGVEKLNGLDDSGRREKERK